MFGSFNGNGWIILLLFLSLFCSHLLPALLLLLLFFSLHLHLFTQLSASGGVERGRREEDKRPIQIGRGWVELAGAAEAAFVVGEERETRSSLERGKGKRESTRRKERQIIMHRPLKGEKDN